MRIPLLGIEVFFDREPYEPRPWYDPDLKPGMLPASFETVDVQGQPVCLASYRGGVVLVHFWASWCKPCHWEMTKLLGIYQRFHASGFEVVSVSLDREETQDYMRQYVQALEIPWTIVWDGLGFEGPLAASYKIGAVPFNVLIGRDGRICAVNALSCRIGARNKRHRQRLENAVCNAVLRCG